MDQLTNLFERPTKEACAESLHVILIQLKTGITKLQLLQPSLYNALMYNGNLLNAINQDVDRMLFSPEFHQYLPKEKS